MTVLTYLVTYCGIAIFVVAVVARAVIWSKMPMHLRWELYPVAHEGRRAKWGGSYLEESEWWTKPRHFSLVSEVAAMAVEILFLVALRENNRPLWRRSFPFHFGLYLVAGSTVLMMVAGGLRGLVPGVLTGPVGVALGVLIPFIGVAGLVLGLMGAVGLLVRRTSRSLRDYTAPADLLNLIFFVIAFGFALVTFLAVDRGLTSATTLVGNLVTFTVAPLPGSGAAVMLPMISMMLLAALVAYIPLTHMSHFVGKYFAYHAIRWADKPNLPGGREEKKIEEMLQQPVTWAGPHINGDGTKTWLDVATEDPSK
jgi:nitrate reductase gamma subunit